MSTSGETADLMVQEGIKITESALKLAGLGAKNLAQLLIAVLNDYEKYAGKTNLKQLIQGNDELTILSIRKEDLAAFHKDSARYGVLYCPIIHKGSDTAEIMARQKDIPQINHILERLEVPVPRREEDKQAKKDESRIPSDKRSEEYGQLHTTPAVETTERENRPSIRQKLESFIKQESQQEREPWSPAFHRSRNPKKTKGDVER